MIEKIKFLKLMIINDCIRPSLFSFPLSPTTLSTLQFKILYIPHPNSIFFLSFWMISLNPFAGSSFFNIETIFDSVPMSWLSQKWFMSFNSVLLILKNFHLVWRTYTLCIKNVYWYRNCRVWRKYVYVCMYIYTETPFHFLCWAGKPTPLMLRAHCFEGME